MWTFLIPLKTGQREPKAPRREVAKRHWHFSDVRFSNRPVGGERFQTIHDSSAGITRGLVLLYGIGT
jgi:hypothetical protein